MRRSTHNTLARATLRIVLPMALLLAAGVVLSRFVASHGAAMNAIALMVFMGLMAATIGVLAGMRSVRRIAARVLVVCQRARIPPGLVFMVLIFLVIFGGGSMISGVRSASAGLMLPLWITLTIAMIAQPASLRSKVRGCAKCKYPRGPRDGTMHTCPECGADWDARGAVVRLPMPVAPWVRGVGVALLLLGIAPVMMTLGGGGIARHLPTGVLVLQSRFVGGNSPVWGALASRPLDPATAQGLARSILDERDNGRFVGSGAFEFIASARAAGLLTPELHTREFQGMISLSIRELPRSASRPGEHDDQDVSAIELFAPRYIAGAPAPAYVVVGTPTLGAGAFHGDLTQQLPERVVFGLYLRADREKEQRPTIRFRRGGRTPDGRAAPSRVVWPVWVVTMPTFASIAEPSFDAQGNYTNPPATALFVEKRELTIDVQP